VPCSAPLVKGEPMVSTTTVFIKRG